MYKINSKHLIFLILGTCIVSLKTYPTILIRNAGRDTWVGVIISSILIFLYLSYILKICTSRDCYNLYDIYCKSLGKILGNIFIILLMIALLLTLVESSAVEANAMHTNMLLETPNWFLLIFFIPPALYAVKKGFIAIIIVTVITLTLIVVSGINLSILTFKYKQAKYLIPIFENGITKGFILSIIKSLGLYGSIFIIYPYLNNITDKSKIKKYSLLALLFAIQIQIVSITGVLSTFPAKRAGNLIYPKIIQTQLISYFGFIESGELFVMLQTIAGWFMKYILTFEALLRMFKYLNLNSDKLIYFISILVFIFSWAISENLFALFAFLNFYSIFSLINFIIVPTIIFTIYFFKTKSNDNKN